MTGGFWLAWKGRISSLTLLVIFLASGVWLMLQFAPNVLRPDLPPANIHNWPAAQAYENSQKMACAVRQMNGSVDQGIGGLVRYFLEGLPGCLWSVTGGLLWLLVKYLGISLWSGLRLSAVLIGLGGGLFLYLMFEILIGKLRKRSHSAARI